MGEQLENQVEDPFTNSSARTNRGMVIIYIYFFMCVCISVTTPEMVATGTSRKK